jgi:hypothetical protein
MANESEWRKRTNELIAEMKAKPHPVDFLVGMAQDNEGGQEHQHLPGFDF